ncbi:MAG: hypothetical protein KDA83_16090 [Planctomycetales bacterium]|nr:hypothetical protein [Planctomycetales bacterium]
MLKGPAIALIVAMGIGMAWQLLGLVLNALGVTLGAAGAGAAGDPNEAMANMVGGTIGIVIGVIGIAIGGFVIYGSLQMMKCKSYGVSMAATIIAMIPCFSPCCLLGLPFGIWAIVVLSKPEVKSAFS